MTARRHVPLAVKLEVALRQLGLDPAHVRLDHSPPIALRERTPAGGYIPDELDPRHMQWLSTAAHDTKTTGTPKGQKVVTTVNGDVAKIAKARRILLKAEKRAAGLAKPSSFPKGRKLEGRPFQKKEKRR